MKCIEEYYSVIENYTFMEHMDVIAMRSNIENYYTFKNKCPIVIYEELNVPFSIKKSYEEKLITVMEKNPLISQFIQNCELLTLMDLKEIIVHLCQHDLLTLFVLLLNCESYSHEQHRFVILNIIQLRK